MKRIILTSLIAFGATQAMAAPGVFDPTFRAKQGVVAAQFGIAYQSGYTKDYSSMTDLTAGDVKVGDVKLAYGIADNLAVTLDTYASGVYANPELGLNYQIMNTKPLGVDIVGKWGIALTENAATGERIGNNNLQAGLHLYGQEGQFQWGAWGLAQYVFDDMGDFWNVLVTLEAQYQLDSMWAIKGTFNYDFLAINEDIVGYDRSLALGLVYTISKSAAVQPYLAYHFSDTLSGNGYTVHLPNNYWQIGAKFGVQF